jgi:hypothetical protein
MPSPPAEIIVLQRLEQSQNPKWEIMLIAAKKSSRSYLHLVTLRRRLMGFNRREWQERLNVIVQISIE